MSSVSFPKHLGNNQYLITFDPETNKARIDYYERDERDKLILDKIYRGQVNPQENHIPDGIGTFTRKTKYNNERVIEDGVYESGVLRSNVEICRILANYSLGLCGLEKRLENVHSVQKTGGAIYPDGARYEGQFQNDQMHGLGIFYYPDGARYEGRFQNDQRHGQGIYYFPDGKIKYRGNYEHDQRHGQGTEYYPDGKIKYRGNFEYGKKNGHGTEYYPDGTRYEGRFQNGQRDGQGAWYFSNGALLYQGEWQNDQTDGWGTWYFSNGTVLYQGNRQNAPWNQ